MRQDCFDFLKALSEGADYDPYKTPDGFLDIVPKPVGWRILIVPYVGEEKTESGIILTSETKSVHKCNTHVGRVIGCGEDAYEDKARFPGGKWCSIGEFVVFGKYSGSMFDIGGTQVRILNDEEVLGIISDPTLITNL